MADIRERIINDFTYHPPQGDQAQKYAQLRERGREMALLVAELVPSGREQSTALTKIEEATMWANAGIARTPPPAS